MRNLTAVLLIGALTAAAAACGDDGNDASTPVASGPTTLAINKSFERGDGGGFTFTVSVTNQGENAAVFFDLSDVWDDGLEITSLGDFAGNEANPIGDSGFDVLLDEFGPGESAHIEYQATCARSGQWTNTATVSADNAGPVTTSVSVSCP